MAIKLIGLRFPDKERTMFYLYLTTHDPNGALAMNKILWDAGYQEHELRWQLKDLRRRPPGQLSLFEIPTPKKETPERPKIDDIAAQILEKYGNKQTTRKQIYQAMADDVYFSNEIDRAITELQKKGKVSHPKPLKNDTVITFSK